MLKGIKIGVYVTGGIAAYKCPDLVRHLIKEGAEVRVGITTAALKFVTPFTFEVLTKYPVLMEESSYPDPVGHIHLADWLDMALVVPATATTMAKLAQGIADNEVTSSLLAVNKPRLFVPAMNNKMWANPATQRNISQLKADGNIILDPATGFLAEGYEGKGRMPEVKEILNAVLAMVAMSQINPDLDLSGKKVLISAGGTQEAIDPVRFISNHSSGKMGLAIAHLAAMAGAQTTLVRTSSAKDLPVIPEINVIDIENARELYQVMHQEIDNSDIVVMAAAVSDYRVAQESDQKIKKDKNQENAGLHLDLMENPDILASLPKDKAVVVGFAAETQQVLEHAQMKLKKKGADMIVANDVSRSDIGFGTEHNAVTLVTDSENIPIAKASKFQIACHILSLANRIQK